MRNTMSFQLNKKREAGNPLTVISLDQVKALEPWEKSYWLLDIRRVDCEAEPIIARVELPLELMVDWVVLIGLGILSTGSGLDIISDIELSVLVKGFEAFLAKKETQDEYNR